MVDLLGLRPWADQHPNITVLIAVAAYVALALRLTKRNMKREKELRDAHLAGFQEGMKHAAKK